MNDFDDDIHGIALLLRNQAQPRLAEVVELAARDAARYRWLKANENSDLAMELHMEVPAGDWDAAIDRALMKRHVYNDIMALADLHDAAAIRKRLADNEVHRKQWVGAYRKMRRTKREKPTQPHERLGNTR